MKFVHRLGLWLTISAVGFMVVDVGLGKFDFGGLGVDYIALIIGAVLFVLVD